MWIYVFVGTLFLKGHICQDPCKQGNYQIIVEPTRSVNYPFSPNDTDLCDRRLLDEGWYRILENGNIATECPAILRCGSLYPVWLNGTLPVEGQRVTLNACQRGFLRCCENPFSVEVQNCNDFNVFYLSTIPACPGRYCTAPPISFSGTPHVIPFIPSFDPLSDERSLAFRCEASIPSDYHRYIFDITWFINQNKIVDKYNITYSRLVTDGVLHRKDWDSHPNGTKFLGFWVMCKMRARPSSVGVSSQYYNSKEFFAGAQIEKTSYTVQSGKEVTIRIKSTVPVACVEVHGHKTCGINIELFSLKDQFQGRPANCNDSLPDEEIKMSKSACGLVFDGSNWDEYHSFKLQTLSDQTLRKSYKCAAKLIAKSNIDTLWLNYQLPEVYILVLNQERPKGNCYSGNGQNVNTFDGRYFTTHDTGEFVLFRHKTKPIEIHTIQRRDGRLTYASNCAVLFRASTDMFVIYGCNSPTRWIARRLSCNRAHQYLEVLEKGQNFEVVMPTGTRITVLVKPFWLNVYITVSALDWEETEGLCGLYNGQRNDDFTDMKGNIVGQSEFMSSWKVPGSRSLFIAKARTEKMRTEVMYCTCYNESHIQDLQEVIKETADCTWKDSLPLCKPVNWKENTCRNFGRKKREIADDFEFDVPIDVVAFKKGPKEFKWENGWTEQKAVNACKSYFEKSKLFKLCSKLTGSSGIDSETCVADIKLSGSTVFLSAALDSIKTACINEIRLNTSFWKPKPEPKLQTTTEQNLKLNVKTQPTTTTTTARDLKVPENEDISVLDIAETVFNNDCPNDCSESGICQQGICDCDDGFEGDDCSVDRRIGPELFGLVEESFCDLSKRPCSFISVFGNGFYASDKVKCRIMEAQIVQYEVKTSVRNVTTDGSLITFAEVKCPLEQMDISKSPNFPVLDAYLVAVSFDEIQYSTGTPIIVYDSTCTICKDKNGTVDCRMRDDVCIVERKCYNQEHYMCKPLTKFVPSKQTTISEIIYETREQTTNSEKLNETSEQTTRSDIMYETSNQTTSSEELYESSKQRTSSTEVYTTSKQITSSEKLYKTSKQTTSSEEQYEPSKQTTTKEILYKPSMQTTSSEKLDEHSKQSISPEILYLGAAVGGLAIVVVPTLLLIRRM